MTQPDKNSNPNLPPSDGYEIGTFHFLHAGWWISHLIGTAVIFYIGWLFGSSY